MPASTATAGVAFAEALSKKDFDAVAAVLDPEVDFRGMTPRLSWEAHGPEAVVTEVLQKWFEETDEIDELLDVRTGRISDREHVAYRFRGHNGDGPYVVEQQAYFEERDGRIVWMRVLCSGMLPA